MDSAQVSSCDKCYLEWTAAICAMYRTPAPVGRGNLALYSGKGASLDHETLKNSN